MTLPTKDEFNPHNSVDEIAACEHFLGKTLEQAEEMFRADSMRYQEDLMWMGPRAFCFYLRAAFNYVQSDASTGDDSFIDALYNIFVFRSDEDGFALALSDVHNIVGYVMHNYQKFKVNNTIYGDLFAKYQELAEKLKDKR